MNDNLLNTLKTLGFNVNQSKIYLAGLRAGTSPASNLGKKVNISRSTAQYTCNSLVEKGVFSVIERGNTKHYSAEDPNKLLALMNKEYQQAERKLISTKHIMSDLKSLINPSMGDTKVKFYSGVDEIISLINDVLEEKEMLYGILELVDDMPEKLTRYINDVYIPARTKSSVPSKALFNNNARTRKYQSIDQKMNRISLLIPGDQYPIDGCLHIYGNKVAFYSYHRDDMTGILIENENIKNILFSMFKLSWNQARTFPENEKYKGEEL